MSCSLSPTDYRHVLSHCTPRPVLSLTMTALRAEGWKIGPLVIVRHGRVAIGDAIAAALGAESVAVLIGERPGLSAPDSMGAYLTFKPHADTSDAERNCISNIRPDGMIIPPPASNLPTCCEPCAGAACRAFSSRMTRILSRL